MDTWTLAQAPVEPPSAQVAAEYIIGLQTSGVLAFYQTAVDSFNQFWFRTDASPIEIANYWGQAAFGAFLQRYAAAQAFIAALQIPAAVVTVGADGFLTLPSTPDGWTINADLSLTKAE